MKLAARKTTARYLGLVLILLIIANCGGGGGGGGGGGTTGPSLGAPTISNLQVRALDPEKANQNVRYVVAFNFTDPDGDVGNGQCEVILNGQSIGRATINPTAGTPANAAQGAVACGFVVRTPAPQQMNGSVHIFDVAGNQSNDLSFVLGISEGQRRGIPEGQKGSFEGRMESATGRR